jgi:hypothetical protein
MSTVSNKISRIAIGCILLLAIACKKKFSPKQTRDNLDKAWLTFLKNGPHTDTTRVKFEILEVSYFEDSTFADSAYYICQFKVRMKIPSQRIDTVGTMNGTISKDFSIVHRKY